MDFSGLRLYIKKMMAVISSVEGASWSRGGVWLCAVYKNCMGGNRNILVFFRWGWQCMIILLFPWKINICGGYMFVIPCVLLKQHIYNLILQCLSVTPLRNM